MGHMNMMNMAGRRKKKSCGTQFYPLDRKTQSPLKRVESLFLIWPEKHKQNISGREFQTK